MASKNQDTGEQRGRENFSYTVEMSTVWNLTEEEKLKFAIIQQSLLIWPHVYAKHTTKYKIPQTKRDFLRK